MSVPDMPSSPGMDGSEAAPATGESAPQAGQTDASPETASPAGTSGPEAETAPADAEQPVITDTTAGGDAPAATAPGAETSETEVPATDPAGSQAESTQPADQPAPATDGADSTVIDLGDQAQSPAPATTQEALQQAAARAVDFLRTGGPAIWAIAALSVVTLALILWKIWRLVQIGAWSRRHARRAVSRWEAGEFEAAFQSIRHRRGMRSSLTKAAMRARLTLPEPQAREETARVAKDVLSRSQGGLRALELISTIAPLLGLLGTVMGMISAFQALQEAGNRADPAMLAGGIWEALLTTAAGMAVAIPASAALTWFEAVIGNVRQDMEDLAARIFIARDPALVEDEDETGDARMDLAAQ
ncbi:MotA/TolQ/ExbB proton channel family protein [Aquicoccus sp. SCR17]|nr:MotA/TolQ/ExbB proton channel family protein [Carideicomes alvinocaridis]